MNNLISNAEDYKDFKKKERRIERKAIETTFKEEKLSFHMRPKS